MGEDDKGPGPLARAQEVIGLNLQVRRDGAALADGLGGSLKETICAMSFVARFSGLQDFALVLGDEDFLKLCQCLPFDTAAVEYVTETGHLRMVTCNGLLLVSRGKTR